MAKQFKCHIYVLGRGSTKDRAKVFISFAYIHHSKIVTSERIRDWLLLNFFPDHGLSESLQTDRPFF